MSRESIGEMYANQIPRLRRYARALTRNKEAAEDLVQDCLERAWRKSHRWEPGTNLQSWLFTVMHNVYVNGLRKNRLQTEPLDPDSLEGSRENTPDAALDLRDLKTGLGELHPEQREVLVLVCVEGMSYAQVAGITGVPIGTVMSRLHRARQHLRRWLAADQKPQLRRIK